MTTTAKGHPTDRAADHGRRPGVSPTEPAPRGVPGPPKARRRWGLFAAMVLVAALGVLGNVWLHSATSTATPVVAAARTIERGQLIAPEDLTSVDVEVDPALRTIPAADLASLVGRYAALDVAAGALLTPESVTDQNVPPAGFSLVGVGVAQAMMPGAPLLAGDRVRVVATADTTGSEVVAVSAVVVSTQAGTDPTVAGSQTIVTVQVPTDQAAQLAAMAATAKVALVLDSRDGTDQ